MSKHLILSVKTYDFENGNKERVVGAKIAYLNKKPSSRDAEVGHPPLIVSVQNMKMVDKLQEVPGLYEMEFEQVVGKNNKPELILGDVDFISSIDMQELFNLG